MFDEPRHRTRTKRAIEALGRQPCPRRRIELDGHATKAQLELGLGAALPLGSYTAVELAIAWSVALGAHTEKFYPSGTTAGGPNPGDPGYEKTIESAAISGEPWFLVRFGLGLRFDVGSGGIP